MTTSDTPIGDAVENSLAGGFPVGLTERGRAIFAGGNALAVNGDDTLNQPVAPTQSADAESDDQAAPAPDSSIPVDESGATPAKETADDQSAATRETREN